MIEDFHLNIVGRLDTGNTYLNFCCTENIASRPPGISFYDTARETVDAHRRERAECIGESVKHSISFAPDIPPVPEKGRCAGCALFKLGDWSGGDGLIHHVNLGMTPAPCQCKCIYCDIRDGNKKNGTFKKRLHAGHYEKLFDVLDYVKSEKLVAPDAPWHVASGEISIHPYRERIFDLVRDQNVMFFTNCFRFDERIAENLAKNPRSRIYLSIDAGTPKTWRKVKGVDNFDAVTDNLVKYYASSAAPGQIKLKYIVLPGVNANLGDYLSVIEIMKALRVKHLDIAREFNAKYAPGAEQRDDLIGAAAYLAAMLVKNEMTFDMSTYTPDENEKIAALGCELLQSGEV
jgi:wyosine [tRNA(Phe)-imidazoG37] synthetase (radical SAM superfamily)